MNIQIIDSVYIILKKKSRFPIIGIYTSQKEAEEILKNELNNDNSYYIKRYAIQHLYSH